MEGRIVALEKEQKEIDVDLEKSQRIMEVAQKDVSQSDGVFSSLMKEIKDMQVIFGKSWNFLLFIILFIIFHSLSWLNGILQKAKEEEMEREIIALDHKEANNRKLNNLKKELKTFKVSGKYSFFS